ncbi:hypothetical protein U9M48_032934 [Paspalum notatum var. saurae]|uniref:DUF8040 domain-containing protein n=1 Tax=Paspalum notatum var. saurae TaxID=547442 RepID=A0AAQ3X520_PASNO
MDSPLKKKSASIKEYLRDISEVVLSRRSRKSNNMEVAEHDQVRQILDGDEIPEGSELYLRAHILRKNAVNRMSKSWYMSLQAESNNSNTSMAFGAAVGPFAASRDMPTPVANPKPPILPHVTGQQWVEMNLRDSHRCYDNFCMIPDDFLHLHDILEFDSVEGLGMFLWACATKQCNRQIKDRFQRSLETISRKMGHVTDVMFSFAQTVVAPKDPTYTHVHRSLLLFAPYFDGCIGALDGTHIPARMNHESQLGLHN